MLDNLMNLLSITDQRIHSKMTAVNLNQELSKHCSKEIHTNARVVAYLKSPNFCQALIDLCDLRCVI